MKRTGVVLLFLFYITSFYVCRGEYKDYIYEFGQDAGLQIYSYNGVISEYQPVTKNYIPVPSGYRLSYIRVVIKSYSPPQVTYSPVEQSVTITYDRRQSSATTYNIIAKATMASS